MRSAALVPRVVGVTVYWNEVTKAQLGWAQKFLGHHAHLKPNELPRMRRESSFQASDLRVPALASQVMYAENETSGLRDAYALHYTLELVRWCPWSPTRLQ